MLFFPPSGYLLSWEAQGQKDSRVERTMSNSTLEYKVTGLTSLTTYTLEVAAVTAAGMGTLSSSTISSGVPPGEVLSTQIMIPSAPNHSLHALRSLTHTLTIPYAIITRTFPKMRCLCKHIFA